jgi:hypothetical protein
MCRDSWLDLGFSEGRVARVAHNLGIDVKERVSRMK